MTRRDFLLLGSGLASVLSIGTASANPSEMATAITQLTGGATPRAGRVRLELPPLVENGNVVPVTVEVDSPMTPSDHVRAIHLFAEKNPQPYVAVFHLGPRAGRARIGTRIRLADSQQVVAVAELSDGSFWSASAASVVTISACIDVL